MKDREFTLWFAWFFVLTLYFVGVALYLHVPWLLLVGALPAFMVLRVLRDWRRDRYWRERERVAREAAERAHAELLREVEARIAARVGES